VKFFGAYTYLSIVRFLYGLSVKELYFKGKGFVMDLSIIIGGKAGAGIKEAGRMLAKVLTKMGYHVFVYVDYPSLIRGGHNFVTIRFSEEKISSVKKKADIIVATDGRSIKAHKYDAKDSTVWIINEKERFDGAIRAPFKEVAPGFFKSSSILGVLLRILGIPLDEGLPLIMSLPQKEKNESIYREAYKSVREIFKVKKIKEKVGDVITGNEAIALGAVDGGLDVYIAYPMTPASPVLHYLAKHKSDFGIKVVQPENEIAVINMALGVSYAGKRSMVGTSGGGFALMTEALSLSGMAEIPLVIYEAQRAGPSTGVPTYTAQSDLLFSLFAGHGDFPRVVFAPGDPQEAYLLARVSLNIAWKFQVPVILLGDKHVGESLYTVRLERNREVEEPKLWDGKGEYGRYRFSEDGVSPLAFPGEEGVVVKVSSYEHDERGITVEDALSVKKMQEKRLKKGKFIKKHLLNSNYTVSISGEKNPEKVILTWGSNKGVVEDIAGKLGFKVIRPLLLEPFPSERIKRELEGAKLILSIECSSSGQFVKLLNMNGIYPTDCIKKYDGRPFFSDELEEILGEYV